MTFSRCLSGLAALSLLASVSLSGAWAQSPRVEKLIGQMTLEETIGVLREALGLGPDLASDFKVLHLHKVLVSFVSEQIGSKDVPPALRS